MSRGQIIYVTWIIHISRLHCRLNLNLKYVASKSEVNANQTCLSICGMLKLVKMAGIVALPQLAAYL